MAKKRGGRTYSVRIHVCVFHDGAASKESEYSNDPLYFGVNKICCNVLYVISCNGKENNGASYNRKQELLLTRNCNKSSTSV